MDAGRALVAVAVVVAAVGGAGGLASATESEAGQEERELLDADAITVTVELREDGAAEWSIQYKYRLDTPNRTRGFERLREHVRASETSYARDVRDDVTQSVVPAENETGRTMSVGNVSVDAQRQTIPQDFGVVVHRFTWHGFASTDGETLRAGDAIRGFWLRPRTELRLEWPAGYTAETVDPEPDESDPGGATWENPDFGIEEPSIVVRPESTSDWADLAAPGLLLLTVVGGIALIRRRSTLASVAGVDRPTSVHRSEPRAGADPRPEAGAAIGAASRDRTNGAPVPADPTAGRGDAASVGAAAAPRDDDRAADGDSAGDGDIAADGERESDAASGSSEPSAPLSNEEQLRRVLDRNDGRVKQQTIADVCDWSASKTSRVVSSLEEEDVVDVFRIGRENVVSSTEDDLEDV